MKYRREIDGLRAVAVVPVILFHAGISGFSGGFVGVDVFFVISGFLITGILLSDLAADRFSLVQFYERRARRILPALFTVMLVCLPFAWAWLVPRDLMDFAQSLVAVATFSSNILFWTESGYFDSATELKPLLHTWSLAVEEQFYILFPLYLMAAWRFGWRAIWIGSALILALSFGLADWAARAHPSAAFYLLPTRAWELLVGSLCAVWMYQRGFPGTSPRVAEFASLFGLALIVLAVVSFDGQTPFPGRHALVPTLGSALVLLFAQGTIVGSVLAIRPLVGIGLISYSAYLWHQPLFAFTRYQSLDHPSQGLMLALSVLVFPVAWLTWHYVEAPFRRPGGFGRRAIFGGATVALVGFAALGLVGHMQKGFDDRLVRSAQVPFGDVDHVEFHDYLNSKFSPCTPQDVFETALRWKEFLRCPQSHAEGPRTVALLGDSIAEHLFIGLAEALPDQNVVGYVQNAMPLLGEKAFDRMLPRTATDPDISVVVLTMYFLGKVDVLVSMPELEPRLAETLEYLTAADKKVVLVAGLPTFPFDPYRCAFALHENRVGKCTMDASRARATEARWVKMLQRMAKNRPRVEFIDLQSAVCGMEECSMRRGDTLLFRDPYHLSIPGSQFVGETLVERSTILSNLRTTGG
ncbi:MAG: acyltransferase family protein [Pseudomonadota bacterium]